MNKSANSSNKRKSSNQRLISVLGPVDNLESYVKADWWRHIFNANYLRTDGDVVGDENITALEVDRFSELLAVDKNASMLDLCCGQGRHVIEFARRGYTNLHGLDRSRYLINRAKSECRKEGLGVSFKEGDARKLPYRSNYFDVVMVLGNSFGYFESSQDDLLVLKEIRRILKPGGKLLIDITDGEYIRSAYEPRSWEWIDKNYFVCRERSLSTDNERLISREVITHVKKGVIADQFYAERLYSEELLHELLKSNEFREVSFSKPFSPESKRNQDLGMMVRRNIVIGLADKPPLPSITGSSAKPFQVAVLMGDPSRPDRVKPGATFDEDDHRTIDLLKQALHSLEGYQFTFFDNHDKYLALAPQWQRDFDLVLNLCDEGFNNDALQELHVPAFLEMLSIPYTGGNPQCLAYCYDKSLIRGLAQEMDIPVAEAYLVKPEDTTFIEITVPFPVIVKPNFGDSSFGITQNSVCHNVMELEQAILAVRQGFGYESPMLVEQYLTGKDISVGIIGNGSTGYRFLPIIEEDYSQLPEGYPKICGYEAKWDPQSPYWKLKSIPAELPPKVEQFLFESCAKLFERLGCRDYARFDWRLDSNGTPRLLEANPNPGWCWDGHLAKMAALDNVSYSEMLLAVVKTARERIQLNRERAGGLAGPEVNSAVGALA